MKEVKTYVRNDSTATVICPGCKRVKHISAEPYRNKKHAIRARCPCGEIFTVRLDFRRHYRKLTSLHGTYSIITPDRPGGGLMHVRNISRSGIGFTVSGRHNFEKNLRVKLDFQLNDRHQTRLHKEAIVRSVKGNYIGCQFPPNDPVEKALGFYLQC